MPAVVGARRWPSIAERSVVDGNKLTTPSLFVHLANKVRVVEEGVVEGWGESSTRSSLERRRRPCVKCGSSEGVRRMI